MTTCDKIKTYASNTYGVCHKKKLVTKVFSIPVESTFFKNSLFSGFSPLRFFPRFFMQPN